MDKNIIIGAMTALITPFKNGKVDKTFVGLRDKEEIIQGL